MVAASTRPARSTWNRMVTDRWLPIERTLAKIPSRRSSVVSGGPCGPHEAARWAIAIGLA